jgi:hypothetical protein
MTDMEVKKPSESMSTLDQARSRLAGIIGSADPAHKWQIDEGKQADSADLLRIIKGLQQKHGGEGDTPKAVLREYFCPSQESSGVSEISVSFSDVGSLDLLRLLISRGVTGDYRNNPDWTIAQPTEYWFSYGIDGNGKVARHGRELDDETREGYHGVAVSTSELERLQEYLNRFVSPNIYTEQ